MWYGGRSDSHINNILSYNDYYNRLRQLATSIYKWEGLPETCNARYIENQLFFTGFVGFCRHDIFGLINSGGAMLDFNVYDEPTKFQASNRAFTRTFDYDNFVVCRNNIDCIPTAATMLMFATRLNEIERTLDNNVIMQKTPYIIRCSDKNKLSWENIYGKVKNNEPAIFVDKAFAIDDVQVLPTQTPFLANELLEYKHSVWAEALTFLGINNVNFEKSSHLLEAEVNANIEHVSTSAKAMYEYRKECANELNRRYGTKIDVHFDISIQRITDESGEKLEEVPVKGEE